MAVQGEGLTLVYDEAAHTLCADLEPVSGAPGIDVGWLYQYFETQGFAAFAFNDAAIGVLLSRYLSGQPVRGLAIATAEDAQVSVYIGVDAMSAQVTVKAARGGRAVDEPMLRRALTEAGVVAGILSDAVDSIIAMGGCHGMTIAKGLVPVHGEDGRLDCLVDEAPRRVPTVDAQGLADYRNLGVIPTVQPGTPLLRRVPATPGTNGVTVTGLSIPARNGKEMLISSKLEGVAFDPVDANLLTAAITGQPVIVKNGVMVEPIYRVADVSLATGNIDYDGLVMIEGDVQAGMVVKATGDIHISGTAEAATLISGGNIVIKGGVLGNLGRKDHSGQIVSCQGSFSATFVQQARIEAGDSIYIDDVAMQSELIAINQVLVGGKNRGYIVGGLIQATLLVKANLIGSAAHTATRIEVGVNPKTTARLGQLAKLCQEVEARLDQVQKILDLRQSAPNRVAPDMAAKAEQAQESLSLELTNLHDEEAMLSTQLDLAEGARVVVDKGVFEGVELYCGPRFMRVEHDRHHGGSFVVDADGNLTYDPTLLKSPAEIRGVWRRHGS